MFLLFLLLFFLFFLFFFFFFATADELRAAALDASSRGSALQRELEACVSAQKLEIEALKNESAESLSKVEELEITVEDLGDEMADIRADLRVERETVLRLTQESTERQSTERRSAADAVDPSSSFQPRSDSINSHSQPHSPSHPPLIAISTTVSDRRRLRRSPAHRSSTTPRRPSGGRGRASSRGGGGSPGGRNKSKSSAATVVLSELQEAGGCGEGGTAARGGLSGKVSENISNTLRRLSGKISGKGGASVAASLSPSASSRLLGGGSFSPARFRFGSGTISEVAEISESPLLRYSTQQQQQQQQQDTQQQDTQQHGHHDTSTSLPEADEKQLLSASAVAPLTTEIGSENEKQLNADLHEEVALLLSGVQKVAQEKLDLQNFGDDQEQRAEALQDEMDELALQLAVMEASKNDVAKRFNNQQGELQTMYGLVKRDKENRQELGDNTRILKQERAAVEKELAEKKKNALDLAEQVDVHKISARHAQDLFHKTQRELQDLTLKHTVLQEQYVTEVGAALVLKRYATGVENQLAATRFQAEVLAATSSRVQDNWDSCEAEIKPLERLVVKLRNDLDAERAKLGREERNHSANLVLLRAEVEENAVSTAAILELRKSKQGLEFLNHQLEAEIPAWTAKWQREHDGYQELARESETSNCAIEELTSELANATKERITQVAEKDLEIGRVQNEREAVKEELDASVLANDVAASDTKATRLRMSNLEDEMRLLGVDKKKMIAALHFMVAAGKSGQEKLSSWMNNLTGSSATNSEDADEKRRKTELAIRREGGIFESVDLGDAPPPLDLNLSSKKLGASFEDFKDEEQLSLNQVGSSRHRVSPEVLEVLKASLVINQMTRRFDILEKGMRDASLENFQNCLKLQICKKEYLTREEGWMSVKESMIEAAREERAEQKKVVLKKKALIIAARTVSETMNTKLKGVQKDLKSNQKKYSKSQSSLAFSHEQQAMAEEDARGNSMRFQELRRLQKVTTVAHRTMHNVFTSVWHNSQGESSSDGGDHGGGNDDGGDDEGENYDSFDKALGRATKKTVKDGTKEAGRRRTRIATVDQQLQLSSNLSDVGSMWLSPQQLHLEAVLKGVERIDEVWDSVTRTFNAKSSELLKANERHAVLVKRHTVLEKWAEEETVRVTGRMDFGSQFNSYLREPQEVGAMTEVSWLQRVPQMNPDSCTAPGFQERTVNALGITWDEKLEMEAMENRAAGHVEVLTSAVGGGESIITGGVSASSGRNLNIRMESVSRRESQNMKPMMQSAASPVQLERQLGARQITELRQRTAARSDGSLTPPNSHWDKAKAGARGARVAKKPLTPRMRIVVDEASTSEKRDSEERGVDSHWDKAKAGARGARVAKKPLTPRMRMVVDEASTSKKETVKKGGWE